MMSPPMFCFMAVGVSQAISFPDAMIARREQRSASSVHQVGREQNCHAGGLDVAERFPQIDAGAGVQAGAGFV